MITLDTGVRAGRRRTLDGLQVEVAETLPSIAQEEAAHMTGGRPVSSKRQNRER